MRGPLFVSGPGRVATMLLGVDVGGTFTDAVLAFDGGLVTAKAPTTPDDQSEGVIAAVDAVLEQAGCDASDVSEFSHGMTVATNALLEGRGARTALIATEGFTDLVALGRQNRAELYRLCATRPAPLVADELRFGAPERMTPGRAAARARRTRRRRARRAGRRLPSPRRSRSCCCTPTATRSTSGDRRGACQSAARRPRVALARGRRHVPRVRARGHHRDRRGALAAARRATCAGSSTAPREAGLPSRRSCSPTAA